MTVLQRLYNKAVRHLLTQRQRSVSDNGHCMYRGSGGMKCAAGIFIPNDKYRKGFEGKGVQGICATLDEWPFTFSKSKSVISFMSSLQYIHDKHYPFEWEDSLEALAAKHKLNTNVLKLMVKKDEEG